MLRREAGADEVFARDRAVEDAAAVDVGAEAEHGVCLRPGEAARDQGVDQDLAHDACASAGCSRGRTPPPDRNSIPPASSAPLSAFNVAGIGLACSSSKRTTVVAPTSALAASSRTLQPSAARAILHCMGVIM